MAIPASAEAMGQIFSEITVAYETRLDRINTIITAARNLLIAIHEENTAEVLATGNATITNWDDFRGNGVQPALMGINEDVQVKGEALYAALDALS